MIVKNQSHISNVKGFTLVELLIVMTIVGTLLSLVGPFAIDALSKAQARAELLSLKTWLRYQGQKAFVTGQQIHLSFNGKAVTRKNTDLNMQVESKQFEYLFFQPQEMVIDSHGIGSTAQLEVTSSGTNLVISLSDWTDKYEKL